MRARGAMLVGWLWLIAACASSGAARPPVSTPEAARADVGRAEVVPLEGTPPETSEAPLPRLESAHAIPDAATWSRLAARPASSSVARTEIVKFLVDLATGRTVWFVDTERWDIHYFFARDRLSSFERPVEDHGAFNVQEYRRPDRRFEMGSLVHYLDSDLWTMELISGDNLEGARVVALFEQIRGAVYFGDRLRYRPMSEVHEHMIAPVRDRLPLTTADEVFAGVRYQPLTNGTTFGTLRFVRGPLDQASARPDQILVLEDLPDEIPVVAGVVSAELQAPLGHIAVLCATRRTPNMGLREALSDPRLAALEGRLVALTVGPQDWSVREASLAEAEAAWAARRPSAPLVPRLDASERRLRPVCELRLDDADTAGAKAAQLGEACGIGAPVRTPGGFSVPFAHYLEHLERAGLAPRIAAMLADPSFRADPQVRERELAALREAIRAAPVDPALISQMRRRMRQTAPDARWILRSSTNAEDLPGFTGAGLYRSPIAPARATDAQLADTLRETWSSVWQLGAFEEREWYRVDHARVAMGVLVQPFVDGAFANGVAITANPFYEGRPGLFVNAQALGGSVTGAGGEEVPEQHVIYTYSETIESELLSRSSRTGGAPLLDDLAIVELADVLTMLHQHFVTRWTGDANAVDVEFLLYGEERHVMILQARPFTVVYGEGQTWD